MTSFLPSTRMDGLVLTGHEIYTRIQGGPGADTLAAAADAARVLAARYERRQARIIALRRRMSAAWQGGAADAAEAALTPLVRANENALAQLEAARMSLGGQASSYRDTFNKVEPVPEGTQAAGVDSVDPYAVDADKIVDENRNRASRNVWVYHQYVMQSQINGSAMPRPYPSLPVVGAPAVTVCPAADGAASGGLSTGEFGDHVSLALGAGSEDFLFGDGQVDPSFVAGQPVVPAGEGDGLTRSSQGGAVTEQGWGPDPARAGHVVAEGAPRGPQPFSVLRDPVVFGGNPGIAGNAGLSGRGQGGRRSGSGEEGGHRSLLRPAVPAAGNASGLGGGMWGTLPPRAGGDDDTKHTRRYGRYLDPNELFACDVPVTSAVIGLEFDDENGEDGEND
jgi:hypothetical protein